jgi:hypothetical protein
MYEGTQQDLELGCSSLKVHSFCVATLVIVSSRRLALDVWTASKGWFRIHRQHSLLQLKLSAR